MYKVCCSAFAAGSLSQLSDSNIHLNFIHFADTFFTFFRICARLRYALFWKTVTRMQLAWDSYNLIVINYSVLVPHFIETIPLVFSVAWEQTAEYRMNFWNTAPRFDLIYLCACLTAQSTLAKLISYMCLIKPLHVLDIHPPSVAGASDAMTNADANWHFWLVASVTTW